MGMNKELISDLPSGGGGGALPGGAGGLLGLWQAMSGGDDQSPRPTSKYRLRNLSDEQLAEEPDSFEKQVETSTRKLEKSNPLDRPLRYLNMPMEQLVLEPDSYDKKLAIKTKLAQGNLGEKRTEKLELKRGGKATLEKQRKDAKNKFTDLNLDFLNKPEQLPNNVINRSKTMNWDKEIAWPDRAPSPTPTEPGQLIDLNAWKYIK